MVLDPKAGFVRIQHQTLPGPPEQYVTLDGYRSTWYGLGWRSPLDDPLFTGTSVSAPNPLPDGLEDLAHLPAIRKLRQKLANARTGGLSAQLVVIGDSRAEGFATTRFRNRWIDQVRRRIQGSKPGSLGLLPASANALGSVADADWPGGDNPWTYSGVTGNVAFGAGFHAAQCTSGSITLTYFGDVVQFVYVRTPTGPAAATVTWDGVAQTPLNAQGSLLAGQSQVYGTIGAYGFHTLTITVSSGTLVFEGASWFEGAFNGFTLNGDVLIVDATHAGFGIKDWAGANNDWSAMFQGIVENAYVGIVTYFLDINDFAAGRTVQQFEDDLVVVAGRLDTRMLASDIGHLFCFLPASADTSAYIAAAWRAAVRLGIGRSAVVDLAQLRPGRAWGTDLSPDTAHPNDAGHEWVAEVLGELLDPTPPTAVPITPERYLITATTPPTFRSSWAAAVSPIAGTAHLYDEATASALREKRYRRWHDPGTYQAVITAEHATGRGILEVLIGRWNGNTQELVSCGTVDTSTPAGPALTTTVLSTQVVTHVPGWVPVVIRKTNAANVGRPVQVEINKVA